MTYTIKQKSTNPIVTFRPKLWAKLNEHPVAASFAISWLCENYKRLTGKTLSLSWDQRQELQPKLKGHDWLPTGIRYQAYKCFEIGFGEWRWTSIEEAFEAAIMMLDTFKELEEKATK